MYERSAIVLERYIEKKFGFNEKYNLKDNFENYKDTVDEAEQYQEILDKEEEAIQKFDEVAGQIQTIQLTQEKLSTSNEKLEEERYNLFNDLDESPIILENKLKKVENTIDKNNEKLKASRTEFMKYLCDFTSKRKQRNKCEKEKRVAEKNYIEYIDKTNKLFTQIDYSIVREIKEFIKLNKEEVKEEIKQLMIKNGKNEKIKFNNNVIEEAVNVRINIAEREAEIYIIAYERLQKLLSEIENDNLSIRKYKKALRDITVKKAFLEAEKEYIVGFLDNERITSINGTKIHNKMMEQACDDFKKDIEQIDNLYDLILREVAGKSTKKAYNELYNKTYLKDIEDKEKNFEEEANNVNIRMGTVINSNYWRIEGIKNVYQVFQEEVSAKFEKDLSEYKIEEDEIIELEETNKTEDVELDYNEEEYDEDDEFDISNYNKNTEKNVKLNINSYDDDEDDEEDDENKYEENDKEEIDDDDGYEVYDYRHRYSNHKNIEIKEEDFINIYSLGEDAIAENKKNSKTLNKNKSKKDKKETKGIFNKIFKEKKVKK